MRVLNDSEKRYEAIRKDILQNELKELRRLIAEECREDIDKEIGNFIEANCKQISSWNLSYHVENLRDKILKIIRSA